MVKRNASNTHPFTRLNQAIREVLNGKHPPMLSEHIFSVIGDGTSHFSEVWAYRPRVGSSDTPKSRFCIN